MKRNEYIDSVKGGLIVLVVFGHYLENLVGWNTDVGYLILSYIYAFHMPLFIFFTGIFVNKAKSTEKAFYFFKLFFVFQIIYYILYFIIFQKLFRSFIEPVGHLWYLMSLSIWILLTPIFYKLKDAFALSLLISMLSGYLWFDGKILSISRTLVFLPFFVLGLKYGTALLRELSKYKKQCAYFSFLGVILSIGFILNYYPDKKWFFGYVFFKDLDVGLEGILYRSVMLILAIPLSILFLLILERTTLFKSFGENTLPIYLLHLAFCWILGVLVDIENSLIGVLVCCLLTIPTVIMLSNNRLNALIRNIPKFIK